MHTLERIVKKLSSVFASVACIVLCLMVLLITAEVIFRATFNISLFIVPELVGYGLAITTCLSMPYTFNHGEHIRIDFIPKKYETTRRFMNLFSASLALITAIFIDWFMLQQAYFDWHRGILSNSIYPIPLWIPKILMGLGITLLVACIFLFIFSNALKPKGIAKSAQ